MHKQNFLRKNTCEVFFLQEILFVFFSGFFGYPLIEISWRGYSHPSMAFAGGICFLGIYYFSTSMPNLSTAKIAFFLSVFITVVEFVFGVIFNILLKMNVWDYSNSAFNLMGQICVSYSVLWFFLCLLLIPLCRFVHNFLFV